ncbi:pirin family protein [Serratia sp. BW106]|uniref:pirin family protein n=1 Tax=Serratia TaxID=613 RepID=UPI000BFFDE48|nr:pirin family protein [Serratia sp. BW106]
MLQILNVERAGPAESRGPNQKARLLVSPQNSEAHSPFILLAEDWFAPPGGFPTHPHRGMETVTFILEGQMLHKDHTGHSDAIDAGDVAFMTAGGGILHSEMPGTAGVHSLQLWLNLPARLKRTPAGYVKMKLAEAPVFRKQGVEARIYSGKFEDIVVPYGSTWPLTLIDFRLEVGASFEIPVPVGERVFVYVVEGEVLLGSDRRVVSADDVAWANSSLEHSGSSLEVSATSAVRLLLYSSPIIDEPIAMGGPFVMNTRQELDEAFVDLRSGRIVPTSST